MSSQPAFDRTRAVIQDGIAQGLHLGAQLYVSLRGEVLIDEAFGFAREDVLMRRDSLMLWMSAGKPITAIAIGKLVEAGQLAWDTTVASVIPEFGAHGKEAVTVRHLLTHTAGLRNADNADESLPWDEKIAWICARPLDDDWVPGERAGYHVSATWDVLGEMVRRTACEPLAAFARKAIFTPLGMTRSFLCLTPEEIAQHRESIAWVYDTSKTPQQSLQSWNEEANWPRCRPGGSARGPVRDLGRFYESLLGYGRSVLRADTVRTMTSRQRAGMFDETFQYKMDWGLGFVLNSNRDGFQMPYGYGRFASPETFGHSGNQCSCAFADPARQLVIAWACNGLPGERKHQSRQRAMNQGIYEDVGMMVA